MICCAATEGDQTHVFWGGETAPFACFWRTVKRTGPIRFGAVPSLAALPIASDLAKAMPTDPQAREYASLAQSKKQHASRPIVRIGRLRLISLALALGPLLAERRFVGRRHWRRDGGHT